MKILIIGGNGTVGSPVTRHFSTSNEVIVAGRKKGDIIMDISDVRSIESGLNTLGRLDAIICIAGEAKWLPFEELTEEDYYIGLKSKLMGQVNLVRLGLKHLNQNGSITLSTGILADDPVKNTSSAAMVNGALHSFVQALDLELEKGQRVNVVSLGMVENAYERYKDYFPGHNPVPTQKAVNAYIRSVEGSRSGEIIRVYEK